MPGCRLQTTFDSLIRVCLSGGRTARQEPGDPEAQRFLTPKPGILYYPDGSRPLRISWKEDSPKGLSYSSGLS